MRKVFLDDLPRRKEGIDWAASVGHKVKFIYDDVEGEFEIIRYEKNKQRLSYLYNGKEFCQKTNGLLKAKLMHTVKTFDKTIMNGKTAEKLIGNTYGELTVIRFDKSRYERDLELHIKNKIKSIKRHWICKCSCGKEISVSYSCLKSGNTSSCGTCYTFEQWCLDNNHQDYLDLWDYELNDKKPSEISYGSGKRFYFKCKRGIHPSELLDIHNLTRKNRADLSCRKCNSFGQYLLDTYGNLNMWSDRNITNPFEISVQSNKKVYMKCNNINHPDYYTQANVYYGGSKCPVCANKKIIKGINDIYTTDMWMVKYFANKEDSMKYSKCSGKKVLFKCPDCKESKLIKISTVYINRGIGCSCGNGVSYPNKFIYRFLRHFKVDFETEKSFDWSNGKRYDDYLPYENIIIENHGIQHYEQSARSRNLKEEQCNDEYKKKLALDNGIKEDNYVILDCRFSNMAHIKKSIMSSNLPMLLNFNENDIDWVECDKFAISNQVKEVCDLWMSGRFNTTEELAKLLLLHRCTITDYLKKGVKHGWCNYDPKEEAKKVHRITMISNGKKVEIFKEGTSLGVFNSCHELDRMSENIFQVKLHYATISMVCRGEKRQYKGFTFKYV